jgi:hypothetical protein
MRTTMSIADMTASSFGGGVSGEISASYPARQLNPSVLFQGRGMWEGIASVERELNVSTLGHELAPVN